jgi:predicted ATP-grasp superfamily ATP-dependent carboligase
MLMRTPFAGPKSPTALVLGCGGAPEGDLNVTRSLGRAGVPVTVVAEYRHALSAASRHCRESHCLPGFSADPERTCNFLIDYARKQNQKPVLFPTADPDLLLVAKLRSRLESWYHIPAPAPETVEALADKRRFASLAAQHALPVPRTLAPSQVDNLAAAVAQLQFPVVIKPAHPAAWKDQRIEQLVRSAKAQIVPDAAALLALHQRIAELGGESLIQEYVAGPDPEHYDLHVYMTRDHRPLAWFTGQKLRVFPAHAGSGCYVRSVRLPALAALGIEILRTCRFTGIANMNFKRDPRSGQFKLLEINPRVSQWNIFPSVCGVNIPLIAYADSAGLPHAAETTQREGLEYLHFRNDRRAFRTYHRTGEVSLTQYLRSLMPYRKTYQVLTFDDPGPFGRALATRAREVGRRFLGRR